MKKLILIFIVILLVVAWGAFYGGMKYGQSQIPVKNLMSSRVGRIGNQVGGGFVSGEIISKNTQSITIKLREGGSKIIFFSEATQIMKSEKGSTNDLEIGKNITINGQPNSDGSVTADSIQIRPDDQISSPR